MARGFETCQYIDDLGTPWRLTVDADYAGDASRGWIIADTPGLYPLPRSWRPREIVGMSDDGRIVSAICAHMLCDLWTGATTLFQFSANDGTLHWASVIGRRAEVRRR